MKTGVGPRQSPGLAAVSPPYARINGIRFSGSDGVTHPSQSHDSPGMGCNRPECEVSPVG